MVVWSAERIHAHIAEHIVHPAHIPLEVESKSADIRRLCYHRPGGALLSNHKYIRVLPEYRRIELLQKRDSFDILLASLLVRTPFALSAVVVEIQHGSHGIHAQTVDMVLLYPVICVGNKIRLYFGLAPVEYVSAPVFVLTLERIDVLIAALAVPLVQACRILREMRGNPVRDNADTRLMTLVDKRHKVMRSTEARRRRKITDLLISP